ncbi:hypothetical protein [Kitasatospora viridis]|nr:hypothetical protein [Kitasatospora viridis]
MLSVVGSFLTYQSLGKRFRTRHPDLAARLQVPDSLPLHLSVPLTGGRSVLLAQWRFDKPYDCAPVWAVVGPDIAEPPRIWSATTSSDILVDALHARAVAELGRVEEQSPWRWDEPVVGEIVALADELAARSVPVLMAVAQNRSRAVEVERGTKEEYFGRDEGDFLVVRGQGSLITVSHKPLSGWVADVRPAEGGASQRLDLGGLLLGQPSAVPGLESGRVDRADLAGLVAELARVPHVPTVDDGFVSTLPAGSTLLDSAARELARTGFAGVVPDSNGRTRLDSDTFHIEWWTRWKSIGLADMQRLYGIAAAKRRRLMVLVTENSATRPALAFADDVEAFVFAVDPDSRRLGACNGLAREVVLDDPTWLPARGLFDRRPT